MLWLTSDQHFYHKNVIPYCKRPFRDLEHMHAELIRLFHECVQDGDTVLMLGDFIFSGTIKGTEIVKALRGNKNIRLILIRGNHDPKTSKCLAMGFDEVMDSDAIFIGFETVELSHFPYAPTDFERFLHKVANFWKFWRREKYNELRYMERRPYDFGRWLLHGHVHNVWKKRRKMINVGVDVWDYKPVSLDQIKALMKI